ARGRTAAAGAAPVRPGRRPGRLSSPLADGRGPTPVRPTSPLACDLTEALFGPRPVGATRRVALAAGGRPVRRQPRAPGDPPGRPYNWPCMGTTEGSPGG